MSIFLSGLDLGQTKDPSAFVIAEVSALPDAERPDYTINRFDVRHVHRWPLATKYTTIVADLNRWYVSKPNLPNSTLLVDATGVGRPVVDMLRDSNIQADLRAYTITGGFNVGPYVDGYGTVPKLHLASATQAVVQQRRVRYADGLRLGPVLEREMTTFQVKVTPDKNESFAAGRESQHDDILLSLALIVWYGEQNYSGDANSSSNSLINPKTGRRRTPFDDLSPGTFSSTRM